MPDPVYPVYVDTNTMDGKKIIYMNGTEENDFLPMPDDSVKADIIYLCSPNNPTGACYSKEQLKEWVDYALANDAVILFDSAYEAFVSEPELPRSIYAVEGAKKCAIEFCSLSKTAGFTGTRFSYTVVPKELVFATSDGKELSLTRHVEQKTVHEVQRNTVHHPVCGCTGVHRAGHERVHGKYFLLYGKCPRDRGDSPQEEYSVHQAE